MRLSRPGVTAAGPTVEIRVDGQPVEAIPGESVAAAMTAAGKRAFRWSAEGRPHGVFCGMGVCFDCVVTIDGRNGQRACLAKVEAGMAIATQQHAPLPAEALAPPPERSAMAERETDLLVVGGGPAGLAAAQAAAAAGASVLLVDERPTPGGQYYKQLAPSQRSAGGTPPDPQFGRGAALIDAVRAAGVEIWSEATVWGAFAADEIGVHRHGTATLVRPRALVIAAGAYERAYPVPGWTLPGFMTTGAAQTFARSYGVAPGRRILIAGNGPLNLQVAVELLAGGAEVVALAESAPRFGLDRLGAAWRALGAAPDLIRDGFGYLARLKAAGVPILWGQSLTGARGTTHVEAATVGGREFAVDTVCVGYGFIPSAELARQVGCRHAWHADGYLAVERAEDGATSLPGIYVAGDGGGIGGARIAEAQGRLAGLAATRHLGFAAPEDAGALAGLRRARRFQDALWQLYAAPPPPRLPAADATHVCRCEEVTLGTLKRHIADGVRSPGALKRLTRAGMGRCQGRYCAPALAELCAAAGAPPPHEMALFAPRAPLKPMPAAILALEKPEWGGHKPAQAPELMLKLPELDEPPRQTDVLVVGGGILGCSTAYWLARDGVEPLVIERDELNAQASGANAGSLHVQLLCFDFGSRAQAGGRPAAETLPLGRDSTELWKELAAALEDDIEMKITGGLMVAENAEEVQFLRDKIACEHRYGITSELVDGADLARLLPGLSDRVIAAEWCPLEGKVSPLVAASALARAAERHGARFLRRTELRGIERDGSGFLVTTNRGIIRCRRLVNAAGPWSPRVAEHLGVKLPVHGAPLQMIVTETAGPLCGPLLAHAGRHLSVKQAVNGNLIIGGGWTAQADGATATTRTLRASLEGNLWAARRVLPAIDRLHVLRSWAAMNVNIDGAPILGEVPGVPGFFTAVTSSGLTLGPIVGRITADLVAGRKVERGLAPYLLERFG